MKSPLCGVLSGKPVSLLRYQQWEMPKAFLPHLIGCGDPRLPAVETLGCPRLFLRATSFGFVLDTAVSSPSSAPLSMAQLFWPGHSVHPRSRCRGPSALLS